MLLETEIFTLFTELLNLHQIELRTFVKIGFQVLLQLLGWILVWILIGLFQNLKNIDLNHSAMAVFAFLLKHEPPPHKMWECRSMSIFSWWMWFTDIQANAGELWLLISSILNGVGCGGFHLGALSSNWLKTNGNKFFKSFLYERKPCIKCPHHSYYMLLEYICVSVLIVVQCKKLKGNTWFTLLDIQ